MTIKAGRSRLKSQPSFSTTISAASSLILASTIADISSLTPLICFLSVQYRAFFVKHAHADGDAVAHGLGHDAVVLKQVEATLQTRSVLGDAGEFQVHVDADQAQPALVVAIDAAGIRPLERDTKI